MTPKQRSQYLRTCGYKETADCMDKMIAVLEELTRYDKYEPIPAFIIDDAKDALK